MKSISTGYYSNEKTKKYIPKIFDYNTHHINTDDVDDTMFTVCDNMFAGFDLSGEEYTEKTEIDECIEFLQLWDFNSNLESSEEDKKKNNEIYLPEESFKDFYIEENNEIQNAITNPSSIEILFQKRGYVISERTSLEENICLKDITMFIGNNFRKLSAFFKQIRQENTRNNQIHQTIYSFGDDKNLNGCIINLTKKLRNCGIVSFFKYNQEKLTITWNDVHKIRQYINGEWLEHYVALIAEKNISEFVEKNNLDYEILMNVKLIDEKKSKTPSHELDVVFRIDNQIFAIEAKSGNFSQYDKLFETYKELKLIPWHYMVVGVNADENVVERMFEFYASEIDKKRIEDKIKKMLVKAFVKSGGIERIQ